MNVEKLVGAFLEEKGYQRITEICRFTSNRLKNLGDFEVFIAKARKRKIPKLSFEVNFDFESVTFAQNSNNEKFPKPRKRLKEQVEPRTVPESFVNHVLSLGFQEGDAALLFEHKEQWTGIQLDSKVKCTHKGCKYETKMHTDCLVDHCKNTHGWREHPCSYKNCNWVSHSSTSYKAHVSLFHQGRATNNHRYKCEEVDCGASFEMSSGLSQHMNVHRNISLNCHFCPYRNSKWQAYSDHLNSHFGNKFHKCDFCTKSFLSKSILNRHVEIIHDNVQYNCPLCDKISNLTSVKKHIHTFHKIKGASFDRTTKKFILPH